MQQDTQHRIHACVCGAKVRYTDEHAGRTLRCKRCAAVFTLPGAPRAAAAPGAYAVAAPELKLPTGGGAWSEPGAQMAAPEAPGERVSTTAIRVQRQVEERRNNGFWRDAFACYTFWTKPANAFTLGLLAVMLTVADFLLRLPSLILFLVGSIIVGATWGFYMQVIAYTAGGEDDLPDFNDWEGLFESAVLPLIRVILINLALTVPALIALGSIGQIPSDAVRLPLTALAVATPVFLAPVTLLAVSLGGASTMLRMDLIIRSAFSAFGAYLGVLVLLGVAIVLQIAAVGGGLEAIEQSIGGGRGGVLLATLGLNLSVGYFMIVAAKTIGLYYRHYSDRLPWSAG